ncbi:MAG: hypothetical protein IPM42_07225 [Saprospiraceae bacterium]|nr:hypothetical protein [Saprospiraceae bacterium]
MAYEGSWQVNDAAKDNFYMYNSKELNTDHGLNWSDYGARWYDACVGRWSSVDPLEERSLSWSPFNYVMNNPLRFIDPDGLQVEDIIIRGNDEFKQKAFTDLQKLTNDKLTIDENGKVTIESKGEGNTDKTLTNGTVLVSSLINDRNITTIEQSPDGENRAINTGEGRGLDKSGTNTLVQYNPDNKGKDIQNSNGTTERPAEIGLAHELIHAHNVTNGKQDNSSYSARDPSNKNIKIIVRGEEIRTVTRENKIRKEQGVKSRQPYNVIEKIQ